MQPKLDMTFREVVVPITEPVTKVGGQPSWIRGGQWPLSRSLHKPMMFIAQVLIPEILFGRVDGEVAYLFMTDDETGMLPTWDPGGGENAIVIQPGRYNEPTAPLHDGPSLA